MRVAPNLRYGHGPCSDPHGRAGVHVAKEQHHPQVPRTPFFSLEKKQTGSSNGFFLVVGLNKLTTESELRETEGPIGTQTAEVRCAPGSRPHAGANERAPGRGRRHFFLEKKA